MALKLANDEAQKETSGGINLSDGNNNQPITEKKNEDPWDFGVEDKPFVVSSSSSAISVETKEEVRSEKAETALKIGKILIYISIVVQIASMIWITSQEPVDVYVNMLKFQAIFGLAELICIVDAILINVLYTKKISLIFIAWLLPFLYPFKRNKFIDGSGGFGTVCCWSSLVASFILIGFITKAVFTYGGLITTFDKETKTAAIELFNQKTEDGRLYEDLITEKIFIEAVEFEKMDGMEVFGFVGYGTVKLEGEVFLDTRNKNVETQLVFIKGDNGKYKLEYVKLGDKELSEYGAVQYWHTVIE